MAGTSDVPRSLSKTGFAALRPGEAPTPGALWAAVGKTRGLVEALLPGIGFLTVYSVTGNLVWSVAAPAALAVAFIIARAFTKSPLLSAFAGLAGILASAGVAIWSGRAEDNFLLGFGVNAVSIVVLVVSLVLRRPLIGVITGLLLNDDSWYEKKGVVRVAVWATWLWITVFTLRLSIQVPLYLSQAVSALALTKLAMGLPLYAAALWFTWLLMRSVYSQAPAKPA